MWNFIKKQWKTLLGRIVIIVLSILLISIIIGILYGVLTRDKTLMEVNGKTISWEKSTIPITVFYDPMLPEHIVDECFVSISRINKEIGSLFLTPIKWNSDIPKYAPKGSVFFRPILDEDNLGGTTSHNLKTNRKNIFSVDVWIVNIEDTDILHIIITHELGHVLGLAHDNIECSMMNPYVSSCNFPKKKFTNNDISLLRDLYLK